MSKTHRLRLPDTKLEWPKRDETALTKGEKRDRIILLSMGMLSFVLALALALKTGEYIGAFSPTGLSFGPALLVAVGLTVLGTAGCAGVVLAYGGIYEPRPSQIRRRERAADAPE